MRRKLKYVPNPKNRAIIYTCAVLALAVYGIPRLPSLRPGLAGTFSTVWILFAALAIASNLYFLSGADKERSKMLEIQALKPEGLSSDGKAKETLVRRRAF